MYLFFVHNYVASEMVETITMSLKNRFSNHCFMVRLNFSLDYVRNCKEGTSIKERNPQFGV